MNTISHPIICIGCHNLIVERNQQDRGCRYCCEFDETGEFQDKCRLNTDGDTSERFDECFTIKMVNKMSKTSILISIYIAALVIYTITVMI